MKKPTLAAIEKCDFSSSWLPKCERPEKLGCLWTLVLGKSFVGLLLGGPQIAVRGPQTLPGVWEGRNTCSSVQDFRSWWNTNYIYTIQPARRTWNSFSRQYLVSNPTSIGNARYFGWPERQSSLASLLRIFSASQAKLHNLSKKWPSVLTGLRLPNFGLKEFIVREENFYMRGF